MNGSVAERLGELLRKEHEAELDRLGHAARVRGRLMSSRPSRPSEALRLAVYALAGALGGALVVTSLLLRRSTPMTFRLDDPGAAVPTTGQTLQSSSRQGTRVRFSDGSTILMQEGAQTRVAQVEENGARVVLDRGRLGVDIVHRPEGRWSFEAGPFQVRVTGTRFQMSWDPSLQEFELTMKEGAVVVTGCSVSGLGLVAGQSWRGRCSQRSAEFTFVPSSATAQQPTTEASALLPAPVALPAAGRASKEPEPAAAPENTPATARSASAAALESWAALAAAGQFREAYQAADRTGFEAECERASASELLALSEAALFSGRTDRARLALMRLRARYPGSSAASTAAFRLGRIAFDTQGAFAEARTWFQTYLQEQPAGGFAREATGRLLEVEYRSGNLPAARALAARYLQDWPAGPHSRLAHSVIGD